MFFSKDNEGQSNCHGAVDIIKSEQQIRESAVITLVHLAEPGLTTGKQAGWLMKYRWISKFLKSPTDQDIRLSAGFN